MGRHHPISRPTEPTPPPPPPRHRRRGATLAVRIIALLLLLATAAVVTGAVLLWPRHPVHGTTTHLNDAVVTRTVVLPCAKGASGCYVNDIVRLLDGPQTGRSQLLTFVLGATDPKLAVGQEITLDRAVTGGQTVYSFADVHRGRPIYLLALLFVAVAVAVGRLRGLAALAGLVFAGAALLLFTIPALILGTSPTLIALVTGGAICLVSLPLAHGFSMRSAVAVLGSLTGMTTAAVIAALSVHALHLTGLSSDEAAYLATLGSRSSVSGLLLCGTVIGAIGVLNDVTVTQASAVYELAAAAPDLTRRGLTRAATRIGRDHIAATIYSLVLAYAGSALPLLLLFSVTDQSVVTVLTSDAFAPEVASGLIGATALVLVVPFTTVIAALLVTPSHRPSRGGHHSH